MGKLGRRKFRFKLMSALATPSRLGLENASFPTLLDFPAPQVRMYPVYTVVAEIRGDGRSTANTRRRIPRRMVLAQRFEFDRAILRQAIEATLPAGKQICRKLPNSSPVRSRTTRPNRSRAAFLRRNGLTDHEQFSEVVLRPPLYRTDCRRQPRPNLNTIKVRLPQAEA